MKYFILLLPLFITLIPAKAQEFRCKDSQPYYDFPLSEKIHDDVFIRNWSAQSVSDAMTFGFHNNEEELEKSFVYFTDYGEKQFKKALEKSAIIETVVMNKQLLTGVIYSTPTIVTQGVINEDNERSFLKSYIGTYYWEVEVPLSLTYQAGAKQRTDKLLTTIIILRANSQKNTDGIGITQWIARR